MNVVNKVTWKCMKQNKKRTIVTICGVIICVAMLSSVGMIAASLQRALIDSTAATEGSYEAFFHDIPKDKVDALYEETGIEQAMRMAYIGDTPLHLKNKYRDRLTVFAGDMQEGNLRAISIVDGHLPTKADEIVLSDQYLQEDDVNYQIGDTITLPVGIYVYDEKKNEEIFQQKVERTYTITGSVACDSMDASSNGYYAFTDYASSNDLQSFMIHITLKDKDHFYKQIEAYTEKYQIDVEMLEYHSSYLIYQGIDDSMVMFTLLSTCVTLGIIILIGGASLIYNAFSISLAERSRYLGMLSSIGATRKQKRNSVLFEALLIGIIAIPLGVLCAIVGLWVTYQLIDPLIRNVFEASNISLHIVIQPWIFLFTLLFSVLILWVSAWIPSKRASRITAISAISQQEDFKIRKKDVKPRRLIRMLFGIEGEMGIKNMKRSRSRYLSTLSSLIVCVVLMLTVNYFTSAMQTSVSMMTLDTEADLLVDMYSFAADDIDSMPDQKIIHELQKVASAQSSIYFGETKAYIGPDATPSVRLKEYQQLEQDAFSDDSSPQLLLQFLGDQEFDAYCKEIGISSSKVDQKVPTAILVNQRTIQVVDDHGQEGYENMQLLNINEGDWLSFRYQQDMYEHHEITKDERDAQRLQIAQITTQAPSINPNYATSPEIILVTNFHNLSLLNEQLQQSHRDSLAPIYELRYRSKDTQALEKEVSKILGEHADTVSADVINISALRSKSEQRNLLMKVFLYGFMALITLVCLANILNSITTSVQLRKREFAMIKSIGITTSKFHKMICFETICYCFKAVLYGVPIAIAAILFLYRKFTGSFQFEFYLSWKTILLILIMLFFIVGMTMFYAVRRVKKDPIIDTIRNESI